MDQEFGHPALNFGQAAMDQSIGMPTQKSTRVKKQSFNTAESSANQPNLRPAGRTMAALVDRMSLTILLNWET